MVLSSSVSLFFISLKIQLVRIRGGGGTTGSLAPAREMLAARGFPHARPSPASAQSKAEAARGSLSELAGTPAGTRAGSGDGPAESKARPGFLGIKSPREFLNNTALPLKSQHFSVLRARPARATGTDCVPLALLRLVWPPALPGQAPHRHCSCAKGGRCCHPRGVTLRTKA